MTHIKKLFLALATFVALGLSAIPASAQENPDFEFRTLDFWTLTGHGYAVAQLGPSYRNPLLPTSGDYFGVVNNACCGAGPMQSSIEQTFVVPETANFLVVDLHFLTNEHLSPADHPSSTL